MTAHEAVTPDTPGSGMPTADVLRSALGLLGTDGSRWVQGSWRRDSGLRCAAAACEDAQGGGKHEGYGRALAALALAVDPLYRCRYVDGQCLRCAENIVSGWNDAAQDYAEIADGFRSAIERAERADVEEHIDRARRILRTAAAAADDGPARAFAAAVPDSPINDEPPRTIVRHALDWYGGARVAAASRGGVSVQPVTGTYNLVDDTITLAQETRDPIDCRAVAMALRAAAEDADGWLAELASSALRAGDAA